MTHKVNDNGDIVSTAPDDHWDSKPGVLVESWLSDSPLSDSHALRLRDARAAELAEEGWEVIECGECTTWDWKPLGHHIFAWRFRKNHDQWRARSAR